MQKGGASFDFEGKQSADAVESWLMDNQLKAECLEDEALEAEIAALEDELEKRRKQQHHEKDHDLIALANKSAD